jgi:hypothetical protein
MASKPESKLDTEEEEIKILSKPEVIHEEELFKPLISDVSENPSLNVVCVPKLLTEANKNEWYKKQALILGIKENEEILFGSRSTPFISNVHIRPDTMGNNISCKVHLVENLSDTISLESFIDFACEPITLDFVIKKNIEVSSEADEIDIKKKSVYMSQYKITPEGKLEYGVRGADGIVPITAEKKSKAIFRPWVDPTVYTNRVPKLLKKERVEDMSSRKKTYKNLISLINEYSRDIKVTIESPIDVIHIAYKSINNLDVQKILEERLLLNKSIPEYTERWSNYQRRLNKNYPIYLEHTYDNPKRSINEFNELKVFKLSNDYLSPYHYEAIHNLSSLDERLKIIKRTENQQFIINQNKYIPNGGTLDSGLTYVQHLFVPGYVEHYTPPIQGECDKEIRRIESMIEYIPKSITFKTIYKLNTTMGITKSELSHYEIHYRTKQFARDNTGNLKVLVQKKVQNYYPKGSYGYCRPFTIEDVIYSSNADLITDLGINGTTAPIFNDRMKKFKKKNLELIALFNNAYKNYCGGTITNEYQLTKFNDKYIFFGNLNENYLKMKNLIPGEIKIAEDKSFFFVASTIAELKRLTCDNKDDIIIPMSNRYLGAIRQRDRPTLKKKNGDMYAGRGPESIREMRYIELIEGDQYPALVEMKAIIDSADEASINRALGTVSSSIRDSLIEIPIQKINFNSTEFPIIDNEDDIACAAYEERMSRLGKPSASIWANRSSAVTTALTEEQLRAQEERIRRDKKETMRRFLEEQARIFNARTTRRLAEEEATEGVARRSTEVGASTLPRAEVVLSWGSFQLFLDEVFGNVIGTLKSYWYGKFDRTANKFTFPDADYHIGLVMLKNTRNKRVLLNLLKFIFENNTHPRHRRYIINRDNFIGGSIYDVLREIAQILTDSGIVLESVDESTVFKKKLTDTFDVPSKVISFVSTLGLKTSVAGISKWTPPETDEERRIRISKEIEEVRAREAEAETRRLLAAALGESDSEDEGSSVAVASRAGRRETALDEEIRKYTELNERIVNDPDLESLNRHLQSIKNDIVRRYQTLERKSDRNEKEEELYNLLFKITSNIDIIHHNAKGKGKKRALMFGGNNIELYYKNKYLLYKQKYLKLKKEIGQISK